MFKEAGKSYLSAHANSGLYFTTYTLLLFFLLQQISLFLIPILTPDAEFSYLLQEIH